MLIVDRFCRTATTTITPTITTTTQTPAFFSPSWRATSLPV
jgi:hypothetical protein